MTRPRNLWVPIGTPLSCLLEEAGGLKEEPAVILTGGPMTGTVQKDLSAPVVKNTSALLCLTQRELGSARQPETVCVRCGHCVDACPMNLNPAFVYRAVRWANRTGCLSCAWRTVWSAAAVPISAPPTSPWRIWSGRGKSC